MIRHSKGPPPPSLTVAAATPGMTWDGIGAETRDPIRAALVRDQGYLCAYCQRRIDPSVISDTGVHEMKIEHWIPRSAGQHHFTWSNLLGVCSGTSATTGADARIRHCDTSRGNTPLFLHPVAGQGGDPRVHVRYTGTGQVEPLAPHPRVDADIRALNLNAPHLRRGRREVLDALRERLQRQGASVHELRKIARRHKLVPGTRTPEHAELVRYYVNKKLRSLGQTL